MAKNNDVYRAFLTLQSLGINEGLIAFIREMNETLAQLQQDKLLQRQYKILSTLRDAALDTQSSPSNKKIEMLAAYVQKIVEDKSNLFSAHEKEAVAAAFRDCVTIGQNHDNEASFEKLILDSGIGTYDAQAILEEYRELLKEADRTKEAFGVYQIDLDADASPMIVASVEKKLKESGIPAVGFYDQSGERKSFLHVFHEDAAHYARALLDSALCQRAICNVRSEESMHEIAYASHQNLLHYQGLSAAEAGKFYEYALGKQFPVFIGGDKENGYHAIFQESNRIYAEKMLARSIMNVGGYAQAAHMDETAVMRQMAREEVAKFLGSMHTDGTSSSQIGYLIDANPNQEGHRIVIRSDSVVETYKDGHSHRIERIDNPIFYEDRVRNMIDNFAKDFAFIPANKAEELGVTDSNFHMDDQLRSYIKEKTAPLHLRTDRQTKAMALTEQYFLTWAVNNSDGKTASEIFSGIKNDFPSLLAAYQHEEEQKIDQLASKENWKNERTESVKEDLKRNIDMLSHGLTEKHLEQFIDRASDTQLEAAPERINPFSISPDAASARYYDRLEERIHRDDEDIKTPEIRDESIMKDEQREDINLDDNEMSHETPNGDDRE